MTDDEKASETARAMAASAYQQMVISEQAADAVRLYAKRHGDHPAFQEYMRDMALTEKLKKFTK
jgi:hypothetical protein